VRLPALREPLITAVEVQKLADELRLSRRSKIIDEALALFVKAVVEVRLGRRLVTMASRSTEPAMRACDADAFRTRVASVSRETRAPAYERSN
jgi:hypothetical protein